MSDLQAVTALTRRMNEVSPLTEEDVDRIHEARRPNFLDRAGVLQEIERRQREETNPLAHFQLPEAEMNAFMAGTKQDLGAQVQIVSDSFEHWLKTGLIPAPYYAERVAILLRKGKHHDLEAAYLKAWLRHFPGGPGARYGKLAERARKMGIEG